MNVIKNSRSKYSDARFDDFSRVIVPSSRHPQDAHSSDLPRAFTSNFPMPGSVMGTPAVRRLSTGTDSTDESRLPLPPPFPSFFDQPPCSDVLPELFGPFPKLNATSARTLDEQREDPSFQDNFKTPSLIDFRTKTNHLRRFGSSSSSDNVNPLPFNGSSSSSRRPCTPSPSLLKLRKLRNYPLSSSTHSSTCTPRKTSKQTPTPRTPTPRTPGTGTTSSSNVDPSSPRVILAITEGRGQRRYEVGMAAIDINRPSLILTQISDTPTYSGTLAKIAMFDPIEIVVPHTIAEGHQSQQLFEVLRTDAGGISLSSAHRRFFNDSQGLQKIASLCLPDYEACQVLFKDKYFALAASNALIKYVEVVRLVMFAGKSLKVEYQGAEYGTFITRKTVEDLELLSNRDDGSKKNSLLSVLDKCLTPSGGRLLRSTILQPPCNQEIISARLDCVEELVRDNHLVESIRGVLRALPDVSQLLTLCIQTQPNAGDQKAISENRFNRVLALKSTLQSIPSIAATLQNVRSRWFVRAKKVLNDGRINVMLQQMSQVLNEEARIVKGPKNLALQRSFGVKSGINERLDVTRQYYTQLIVDMTEYVQNLASKYDLPLKLQCNATRGYHVQVQIPKKFRHSSFQMPAEMLQVHRTRSLISCTTEFLCLHNDRVKNLASDLVFLSDEILRPLLDNLRQHMGCLYLVSEMIAELDMIVSLATVSRTPNFTRPTFDKHLAVVDSRHPILDVMLTTDVVPNDVFSSEESNFTVLTGPNMSGKSIYLRQVLILQIMAQVGSFVPAKKAKFRIADRIYSRLRFEDEIEKGAGALVAELREVSLMFKTFSARSIVVLDETCQGTSVEEGIPLAWALCEAFLDSKAFVFFATHLHALTKLANVYPRVTNFSFEVEETQLSGGGLQLQYSHRLVPGPTTVRNYGLRLAETADLPASLLEEARDISEADTLTFEAPVASEHQELTRQKLACKGRGVLQRLLHSDKLRLETALNIKLYFWESVENLDKTNETKAQKFQETETEEPTAAARAGGALYLLHDYSSSTAEPDKCSDIEDDRMEMDNNLSDGRSDFSFQSATTVLLNRNTPPMDFDLDEMYQDSEGTDDDGKEDNDNESETFENCCVQNTKETLMENVNQSDIEIFEQAIRRHEELYRTRPLSPLSLDSSPLEKTTPRPAWGLFQTTCVARMEPTWEPPQNTASLGFFSGPGTSTPPVYSLEHQRRTGTSPMFQRELRNLYPSSDEEFYP